MSCPGSPSPRSKENARGCDGGVNAGGGGAVRPPFRGLRRREHSRPHSHSLEQCRTHGPRFRGEEALSLPKCSDFYQTKRSGQPSNRGNNARIFNGKP